MPSMRAIDAAGTYDGGATVDTFIRPVAMLVPLMGAVRTATPID